MHQGDEQIGDLLNDADTGRHVQHEFIRITNQPEQYDQSTGKSYLQKVKEDKESTGMRLKEVKSSGQEQKY